PYTPPCRSRIKLSIPLHAHIRTSSHISQRYHRIRNPGTPKRRINLGVIRDRHHQRPTNRVRHPLSRPPTNSVPLTNQHNVRQIHNKRGRPTHISIRDRQPSLNTPTLTIPNSRCTPSLITLTLHLSLTRQPGSNRHKRDTMLITRNNRLRQLKTKIVLIKNLTKLKRIIRPRNTQPINLRTNRSLTDSHIRLPKIKLRILQLRSQH